MQVTALDAPLQAKSIQYNTGMVLVLNVRLHTYTKYVVQ